MKLKKLILGTSALIGVGRARRAAAMLGGGGRGHARWRARPHDHRLRRGPRRSAASWTTPSWTTRGPQPRLPQRHRGPRPRPRQERGDRPRVRRARSSSRPTPTAPPTPTRPGLPAGRLGRGPPRRRGRRGRQQRGRRADDRCRHRRYRRLGRGDHRGAGGVPDQHQRRDQGPLLHAELRRLQRRRELHADQQEINSGADNGQFFGLKDGDRSPWTARTSSRVRLVYDGEFGGFGILASVVGVYGELKNDCRGRFRQRRVVRLAGRRQRRPVRLQAGRRLRRRRMSATPRTRLLHRRHRLRLRPGEHLGDLRPAARHQLRRSRRHRVGDNAYNLVFSADVAMAGPGAGGRREPVRQRPADGADTGTGDTGWTGGRQRPPSRSERLGTTSAAKRRGCCPAAFRWGCTACCGRDAQVRCKKALDLGQRWLRCVRACWDNAGDGWRWREADGASSRRRSDRAGSRTSAAAGARMARRRQELNR